MTGVILSVPFFRILSLPCRINNCIITAINPAQCLMAVKLLRHHKALAPHHIITPGHMAFLKHVNIRKNPDFRQRHRLFCRGDRDKLFVLFQIICSCSLLLIQIIAAVWVCCPVMILFPPISLKYCNNFPAFGVACGFTGFILLSFLLILPFSLLLLV